MAVGSRCGPPPERKYSHIEEELFAIVYGCQYFHVYLYGRSFELETDYRRLEVIYKAKPQSNPTSASLERWRI